METAFGYVYARYSRPGDAPHGAQRDAIRRYARRHKLCLLSVLSDDERWGPIPLSRRPKLARLLAATQGLQQVHWVIIDTSDRLSDDPVVLAVLVDHIHSLGIRVAEASTSTALAENQLGIEALSSVGGLALSQARKEVGLLKARATRIRNCTTAGRRPYGSIQDEQKALSRLFELAHALPKDRRKRRGDRLMIRRSFAEIAEILNCEGHPTRTGKPWTAGTVRGIIQRERKWLLDEWSRPLNEQGRAR